MMVQFRAERLSEPRARWIAWFATRGFVLAMAGAMMLHHDWKHLFDDLNVYSRWGEGLAHGEVPVDDPMWQYPPLAAFVFAAVGLLGAQPWLYALLFVGVDVGVSLLLAADAQRRGRWHGFAVWLAAPLLLGPILYGRYDVVPTWAALAGLLAAATPALAGALLAVGGGLKVWPAVMGLALPRLAWLRGALGGALAGVTILAVSAATFPGVVASFVGNGEARGLQTESVAALPFVWGRFFLGAEAFPEAFRYGSSEVDAPMADVVASWLLPLTAIGLVLLIAARALGRLDRVPIADLALLTILWLMVTSRVLSPQYNVWVVGIAALVWAAGSPVMQRATMPVFVTALAAQLLYPFALVDLVQGGFVGIALHTVRIGALVLALVMAAVAVVRVAGQVGDEPAGSDLPQKSAIRA